LRLVVKKLKEVIKESNYYSKAFTLVEILVVVAVFVVLTSVLLAILNPLNQIKKARDSERRNTLKRIQQVLEQYYDDHGNYPLADSAWYVSEPPSGGQTQSGMVYSATWIPDVVAQGYIPSLPHDPIANVCHVNGLWRRSYVYRTWSNGQQYSLISICVPEAGGSVSSTDGMYDPYRPGWAWKVCAGTFACPSL
jgi:prepilin-type N-terminal cleavage/methylation domain-containing protein